MTNLAQDVGTGSAQGPRSLEELPVSSESTEVMAVIIDEVRPYVLVLHCNR